MSRTWWDVPHLYLAPGSGKVRCSVPPQAHRDADLSHVPVNPHLADTRTIKELDHVLTGRGGA